MSTALLEHGVFVCEKGNYHANVIALLLQWIDGCQVGAEMGGDVFSASMVNV